MKKKNSVNGTTLKRPTRLVLAKEWIGTYTGKNIVKGYAKHYHTDLLCAINELTMLGVVVSEEYKEAVKRSVNDRAMQKRKKKEAAENRDYFDDSQDDYFSFIAGYTSGGVAYGLSWEETPSL